MSETQIINNPHKDAHDAVLQIASLLNNPDIAKMIDELDNVHLTGAHAQQWNRVKFEVLMFVDGLPK